MPDPSKEGAKRAALLAHQADHESVTADRLTGEADAVGGVHAAPVELLAPDEQPEYLFESDGQGVGIGSMDNTLPAERGGYYLFTDRGIRVLIGAADEDKTLGIPYGSVTRTEYTTGMMQHRIEIEAEGTTYYLWLPTRFEGSDLRAAVEYATFRHREEGSDELGDADEELSAEQQSIREQLERLGDARDRGLIDEEEFERRKEDLLDG